MVSRAYLMLPILIGMVQIEAACAQNSVAASTPIAEDQLLVLLERGQFQDLDRKLQALQKTYVVEAKTEEDIHRAVYQFYRADPRLGQALNKWVADQPSSAMPLLARGLFRTKMGWVSRGAKWASDTTDTQFSGMAEWFNAAKADFDKALGIDPSLVEAYCFLIEIDMNEGGQKTRELFDRALKVNPSSLVAREFYLHSQLPRWGGSYEAMQKTILESRPYYKNAPRLKVLEGRIAADLGEMAMYNKDYKGALKYFDEALANGNFWFYNQKKGEALWGLDDFQGAINQYSLVIRDKPGYKRAWWMRSQAYKLLGQFQKSLLDISYAINIEPLDDLPIAARGYVYQLSGNLNLALEDFRSAAKLNPGNQQHQKAIAATQELMLRAKQK